MKAVIIGLVIAVGGNCDSQWDFNNDGCVGAIDLSHVLEHWGEPYNTRDLMALLEDGGPCEKGGCG